MKQGGELLMPALTWVTVRAEHSHSTPCAHLAGLPLRASGLKATKADCMS